MLTENKCELGTKSQSLKAEKILDLALKLLPHRPTPIDLVDVLVGLKIAQHMWKEILVEHQIGISINDEFMLDSLIQQRFGSSSSDSRIKIKRKRK